VSWRQDFADIKKTEDAVARGTMKGVTDALREFGARNIDGAGGGYKPMAYHPDGGDGVGTRPWGIGTYKQIFGDDGGERFKTLEQEPWANRP
jgi:hypothetical protein